MDSWLSWKLRRLDDRLGEGPPQRPPDYRPEDGPLVRGNQYDRAIGAGMLVIGLVIAFVDLFRAQWLIFTLVVALVETSFLALLLNELAGPQIDLAARRSRQVDPRVDVWSESDVLLRVIPLLALLALLSVGLELAIPAVVSLSFGASERGGSALPDVFSIGWVWIAFGLMSLLSVRRVRRLEDRLEADILWRPGFNWKPRGFYLRPRGVTSGSPTSGT